MAVTSCLNLFGAAYSVVLTSVGRVLIVGQTFFEKNTNATLFDSMIYYYDKIDNYIQCIKSRTSPSSIISNFGIHTDIIFGVDKRCMQQKIEAYFIEDF